MRTKDLSKLIVLTTWVIGGCATAPPKTFPPPTDYVPLSRVQILDRYNKISLNPSNLREEIRKCVPQIGDESASIKGAMADFPSRNVRGLGHISSSRRFLLKNTTGVCLEASSEKFPIFAAETFEETANPKGVPPDVTYRWYREIGFHIASKGVSKVAYVFASGNANIVSYWAKANSAVLEYSSELKKVGTWETETLDARYAHPSLNAFEEFKRNNLSSRTFPFDD